MPSIVALSFHQYEVRAMAGGTGQKFAYAIIAVAGVASLAATILSLV